MKIKNDKEIVIGKAFGFDKDFEVPFFVKDIKQLCFNPFANTEYKYSVLVNAILSDEDVNLLISKEKYEYLMEKLGANDDDD